MVGSASAIGAEHRTYWVGPVGGRECYEMVTLLPDP